MLSANANFDAKHDLDYKTPIYLVHFDGSDTDFCNHAPLSPDNNLKYYLVDISGNSQKVIPEEGKGSISGLTIRIQDYDSVLTAIIGADDYYYHRKKTTVKAGYLGMAEADMLTVFTGWVTGLKQALNGMAYQFNVTDPQKWQQRKVFRSATELAPVVLQGNPINILLSILTSTGAGTNGDYDYLAAVNGLGIDDAEINISNIEDVRDKYFPGDSNYMAFSITEKIKAKDFIEKQILKCLNVYPAIDGQGKYNLIPVKPPIIGADTLQAFTPDNIIGLPKWDSNLVETINEVEIHYNYDGEDYDEDDYIDTDSLNNRGPGKKALEIKSQGWHTNLSPSSMPGERATDQISRRKDRIFGRFATPPTKISFTCFFSRWLSEAGDIVSLTHSLLPDLENGNRGIEDARMEIISRTIDWKNGRVKVTLLDTGFDKGNYVAIGSATLIKSTNLITP